MRAPCESHKAWWPGNRAGSQAFLQSIPAVSRLRHVGQTQTTKYFYKLLSEEQLIIYMMHFHCSSVGKESTCSTGSIPGLGRSPGEGNGNPFQYSFLQNPMDRGAWLGYSPCGQVSDATQRLDHMAELNNYCMGHKAQNIYYPPFTERCLSAGLHHSSEEISQSCFTSHLSWGGGKGVRS